MRTSNAMQLKARISALARNAGIPAQAMLQSYLLERFLNRLSRSSWRDYVVIKGGVLISSIVGVGSRTTMDLDTTITGFDLTHEAIKAVFAEIVKIDVDDDWIFEIGELEDIRESDDYPGVRLHLKANYAPMSVPLTIDITTGDRITPEAIDYSYPLLFDEGRIIVKAYPVETVLAEKLETIVTRGVANTRPRDYYDIYILFRTDVISIDFDVLREALCSTCEKRQSEQVVDRWAEALGMVATDGSMLARWEKYIKRNPYAMGISLQDCCDTVRAVMEKVATQDVCPE